MKSKFKSGIFFLSFDCSLLLSFTFILVIVRNCLRGSFSISIRFNHLNTEQTNHHPFKTIKKHARCESKANIKKIFFLSFFFTSLRFVFIFVFVKGKAKSQLSIYKLTITQSYIHDIRDYELTNISVMDNVI